MPFIHYKTFLDLKIFSVNNFEIPFIQSLLGELNLIINCVSFYCKLKLYLIYGYNGKLQYFTRHKHFRHIQANLFSMFNFEFTHFMFALKLYNVHLVSNREYNLSSTQAH